MESMEPNSLASPQPLLAKLHVLPKRLPSAGLMILILPAISVFFSKLNQFLLMAGLVLLISSEWHAKFARTHSRRLKTIMESTAPNSLALPQPLLAKLHVLPKRLPSAGLMILTLPAISVFFSKLNQFLLMAGLVPTISNEFLVKQAAQIHLHWLQTKMESMEPNNPA